jgi:hypothetical protein
MGITLVGDVGEDDGEETAFILWAADSDVVAAAPARPVETLLLSWIQQPRRRQCQMVSEFRGVGDRPGELISPSPSTSRSPNSARLLRL